MQIEHFRYAKHLIFHPFDGFYDLKHEKRGSVGASVTIIIFAIVVFILKRQLSGFIFNINELEKLNISAEAMSVLLPLALFCVSNWAVTTLLDGEGSFKDIVTYVGYCFVPIIVLELLAIILSNVLTITEIDVISYLGFLGNIWFAFLLFFGTAVTHQYTVRKTIFTFIIIVISMGLIVFISLLFFTLIERIYAFFNTIYMEIMLRQ